MPTGPERSEEIVEERSEADASLPKLGSGFPFIAEAQEIPHRMQQVLINWIFIFASIFLLLDFLALHALLLDAAAASTKKGAFAELCNWFGVVEGLGWLTGFILLAHWLHSVRATHMGLAGCYLKLLASVFFNLQPMTGTMNDPRLGGGAGLWWSNLTGIIFFHVGNLVSCLDFYLHTPPGADKNQGWFFHGNLPITAMWVNQAATWVLVAGNIMGCDFAVGFPDAASWAPVVQVIEWPVFSCQVIGALLLLLGSVIYAIWCAGFHNLSH